VYNLVFGIKSDYNSSSVRQFCIHSMGYLVVFYCVRSILGWCVRFSDWSVKVWLSRWRLKVKVRLTQAPAGFYQSYLCYTVFRCFLSLIPLIVATMYAGLPGVFAIVSSLLVSFPGFRKVTFDIPTICRRKHVWKC